MPIWGIVIATITAFVVSSIYYVVMPAGPGGQRHESAESERPRPAQIVAELARSAIVACLVAGLLVAGDWHGPAAGTLLGLALCALPVVLLWGSVMWEKAPARRAVLHGGDWVIKLVVIGALVGLFA